MKKSLLVCVAISLAAMSAPGQVTLKHKLVEGEKITYETKLRMKQTISIDGAEFTTSNRQTVVVSMQMGKRDKNGLLPCDCAIAHLKTTLSLPGSIEIAFDSEKPDTEMTDPRFEPIMNALRASAKLKYRQVYGKNDRVISVTGSESILKTLDPTTAALLKDQINAEYLKMATNQDLDQIPGKPVKKGDKWQRKRKMQLGSGQTMKIDSEYEYLGTVQHKGKTLHKIKSVAREVSYEQDPAARSQWKVTSSDLGIETLEGAMYFDQEAGRICEAYNKSRISGDMKMLIQGQEKECRLDLFISADTSTK